MPEAESLAAHEKRVGGVFALMLGAGLVLDCHAVWAGSLLIAFGGIMLAWGLTATGSKPLPVDAATARVEHER